MKRTFLRRSPVVTLLSSSPALSRRMQAAMHSLFGLEPEVNDGYTTSNNDKLDNTFRSFLPGFSIQRWDSVASQCPHTGTIFHWLSIDDSNKVDEKQERMELLSLSTAGCAKDAIESSRDLLAKEAATTTSSRMVSSTFQRIMAGRMPSVEDLTGVGGGLPLMSRLASSSTSTSKRESPPQRGLQEICIPHYDDATYHRTTGRTLLETLSHELTNRPVTGLFQMGPSLVLRPIPSAKEDRQLSAPSLVFSCANNFEETMSQLVQKDAVVQKIGFSGANSSIQKGQFMVAHRDIPRGLDLRITNATSYSSSFPEAQEALLAASLPELQNTNVLLEGGNHNPERRGRNDALNGLGDCWVEFRANVKHASGYLKRTNAGGGKVNVAKPPDLPYE